MAEIKSTLDIVMEKTKHMTLTEEEKKEQKKKDFMMKLNGLAQKYQDGALRLDEFQEEFGRLREEYGGVKGEITKSVLFKKIDLEKDNRSCLELLSRVTDADVSGMESTIQSYQKWLHSARQKKEKDFRKKLSKKYRISGSAVEPNVEIDPKWQKEKQELQEKYYLKLKRAMS